MTFIIQFIVAMIATISFAILFSAPKQELLFCGLSGAIGWLFYFIIVGAGLSPVFGSLIGTLILTLFSRTMAVIRRCPATMFLLTGIFPLVPGAGIYYTAYFLLMNDLAQATAKGIETFKVAGAIALGIVFGFAIPQSWFNRIGCRKNSRNEKGQEKP